MKTTTFYKIVPVKPVNHGSCIPGNNLGNGGFGDVVACRDGKYVMKMTRTTRAFGAQEKQEEMVGEYEYIDYYVPDGVDKYLYVAKMYPVMKEGGTTCYDRTKLVMDRMTGDLYSLYNDFIQGDSNTSWRNIVFINNNLAPELDKMLTHLHETVGYCHNDIKPANIGYTNPEDGDLSVKLLDMGSSVKIEKDEKPYKMRSDSRLQGGTVVYMTKNTFEEIQDSKNRDRWAMGCTLYELVAGVPMNSGLNPKFEFSYMTILPNYNDALLRYMLGYSDEEDEIISISNTMREARTKFLAAFKGFETYQDKLVERIYNYMKPSLEVADINPLARGGGSSRFRRGGSRICGGGVCRDPIPKDDGVITGTGKDGRMEIIRVTDISKYRVYIKTMKNCTIESVQSAGNNNNNNNKPTRKKITEKQYERSKNAGKRRVARYRLKDGSYVHYMYQ